MCIANYKTAVKKLTDGITNKGKFPGNRVAKVLACALSLTEQSLLCAKNLKEKKKTREELDNAADRERCAREWFPKSSFIRRS